MDPDLLLCDVGNTTIKIGIADSRRVLVSYALPVHNEETSDSLGLALRALMHNAGVDPATLKGALISSVVPPLDPLLREGIGRHLGCHVFFAPADLPVPLENRYARPDEVGADRLIAAYAARSMFPATNGLIVVDFGTALTFDCVDGQAYVGGLIFPGPATCARALGQNTARLPTVSLDIRASEPAPCRDTATSIQHGLVFGFVCVTEGLCARLKRQLPAPVKILATGGFANAIARVSSIFDTVLPQLVLEGLRRLYYEQKDAVQE